MKVLVIGSGGREHALVWRLKQSPSVKAIYAIPGNPGIARSAKCLGVAQGGVAALLSYAYDINPDLTVVGPEAPLVDGVVDAFRAVNLAIIGPVKKDAQLEGSKVFAKQFFAHHAIPTAAFQTAETQEEALRTLAHRSYPLVIKTDGLAAGKGVMIARDENQAREAIPALKPPYVIEDYLEGEEVSFIVLSDGKNVVAMEPCQDHKRAFDHDSGPNTGGMGAYCDSHILTDAQRTAILDQIIYPTVAATGFTGFLYAGLMMTADGPKLLEFNVRLGDPETQPIMHRLDCDLAELLLDAAHGDLAQSRIAWRTEPSLCVVLAAAGYPGKPRIGDAVSGIDEAEATGAAVFQAGTRVGEKGLETAGGRVAGVTARGPDLAAAARNAYAAVDCIHFEGMHYRRDIGHKGFGRYNENTGARSSDG